MARNKIIMNELDIKINVRHVRDYDERGEADKCIVRNNIACWIPKEIDKIKPQGTESTQ